MSWFQCVHALGIYCKPHPRTALTSNSEGIVVPGFLCDVEYLGNERLCPSGHSSSKEREREREREKKRDEWVSE